MASTGVFFHPQRGRSPSPGAFLARVSLCESTLIQTLIDMSKNLVNSFSNKSFSLQCKNFRSLIRKIEIFIMLFEHLHDSGYSVALSSTAKLCFEEFYVLLYQSKILFDDCTQTSRIWLLIQNCMISHGFQYLDREISMVLDVCPLQELISCEDVREQVELLRKQLERNEFLIDQRDEAMRIRLFGFVEEFGFGTIPDAMELRALFQERLGIEDANSYRREIEFLEELICHHEDYIEPNPSVLKGIIALTQYCRFLFCGFEDDDGMINFENHGEQMKNLITEEIAKTFVTLPKEFSCPISLDLMQDPVVVSTGQTFDRSSISKWLKRQHMRRENYTCPTTGQLLAHIVLAPNRALKNLISLWCVAQGMFSEPKDTHRQISPPVSSTRAVIEANRATAMLLIKQLSCGPDIGKTVAARWLQMLASIREEDAVYIAVAGSIPLFRKLLSSPHPKAQENSINAILTLSAYYSNMSLIMDEVGCLELIVKVMRSGYTEIARENAASILSTLCTVHDYKTRIAGKEGAISGLLWLLKMGTPREKKVAIGTLYLLSSHVDNCSKLVEADAVEFLAEAMENKGVAESATGALNFLVKHPIGANAVRKDGKAISGLLILRISGTNRARATAVATLRELYRDCLQCNQLRRAVPAFLTNPLIPAVYRFREGQCIAASFAGYAR
ncbi:U-box domain-containing protein [Actinidia chinensis var. chinensis]|uniref:RING-type E3 ubiquitin transferase n=1 Tax=Actinidia chinensis var. chinensis TaxID=1590841 RepID=A0A2R6QBY2_ACTCC|nr:U-box domain-containing protein [Actinidia chinensis var. chinensis]